MSAILSVGLGYLIGCISPAAWIGKKKHVNLKEEGTKNLGATNTALVLGKAAGIFVMAFDIAKSVFSYKIAKVLFPQLVIAGILACIGCILGHCFPFTMGFEGGKGLAAFGGLVMAYDLRFFFGIVAVGLVFMTIYNTGAIMPFFASLVFPVLVYLKGHSLPEALACAAAGALILFTHKDNLKRAKEKNDVVNFSEFFATVFKKKK